MTRACAAPKIGGDVTRKTSLLLFLWMMQSCALASWCGLTHVMHDQVDLFVCCLSRSHYDANLGFQSIAFDTYDG